MTLLKKSKKNYENIVGVIPAGGLAKRIAPLPCSKEVYPIGFQTQDEIGTIRPKVACEYLLERMSLAGVTKVYIVLREGKWDIPAYLKDGTFLDMHLAYLIMNLPFGVPFTLDQAYPFTSNSLVAFGFPDIIFQPDNAFNKLLTQLQKTDADLVLGLFPVDQSQKWDMVKMDRNGYIKEILIKPVECKLKYAWVNAVWTPVFTNYIHEYISLKQGKFNKDTNNKRELYLGEVIQSAINDGLKVDTVQFPHGSCLDIGTPEDLAKAVNKSD